MYGSVLFWNVDTQIDFMKAGGALYVQDAENIQSALAQLTILAEKYHIMVINSCDYHNEDTSELSDIPNFVNTFPPHCMANTKGQEFIQETKPKNAVIFDWTNNYSKKEITEMIKNKRNIIIRKDIFDIFGNNSNAENILRVLAPKKIFVYGVATNVCVNAAVMGLAKRGYTVFVVQDAIKELPNIPMPFDVWRDLGITFINLQHIRKYL